MHVIPIEGSYNARGFGRPDRPWLVRSAALDGLAPGGERALRERGVDLVLDLREPDERAQPTHRLPVRSLPLYGEVPPATGSLERIYTGLLTERGDRVAVAVAEIAEHSGTVVVHCTAGKDRTGLVVALARLAAGEPRSEVTADYALSGASVRPARAGIAAAQLDALDLTPAVRAESERLHLDSPAEALEYALELVDRLGGVDAYLIDRGATPAQLAALADRAAGRASDRTAARSADRTAAVLPEPGAMSRETGRFTILHLSDVHATESGLLYGAVDGIARLERVGDYARATGITPEAVVITGDLVERGNPGAYTAVADACRRLGTRLGAPVLTVLGNHDDPVAARLLPGHESGHVSAERIDGIRVIRLDSHRGELDAGQLEWLAAELATPAERGSVIALHHAPIGSPLPTLRSQGLANADALLAVLEGSDVRAILAGHFHHGLSAQVRGIPVFVGPSLAYHQVMDAGPDAVAGHDSPMFALVQLSGDGVVASTVSLQAPRPLFTRTLTHARQEATHVP